MKNKRHVAVVIAVSGLMAALVCVTTMLIQIPIPATEGYINIGDTMIMVSALTFGTVVGGFAGGVGPAIADIITGWGFYAPLTFIVKGIEGALVGKISNGKDWKRDVLAEVPGNIFQVAVGGFVGIPLSLAIRKYLVVPRL
jgi:uncharacterized membrane protein